jgi:NTE family protein
MSLVYLNKKAVFPGAGTVQCATLNIRLFISRRKSLLSASWQEQGARNRPHWGQVIFPYPLPSVFKRKTLKRALLSSLLLTALALNTRAQVKNIVFEGAGIRGIAYAGVISELEQSGTLSGIEKVGGTSAGAITALLLCVGYTSAEITAIVHHTPFKKFNQGRFLFPGGINRLRRYYGWYHGEQMEKWLDGLLKAKTGNAHMTFRELHEKGYKDLYITGTCLNKQRLVVFSYETYPHMKVRDAVRVSTSIPLYFEPLFLDSTGQVVKHPKSTSGLDIMVDGGFTANFPIRIFDSTRYTDPARPNTYAHNPYTIGFRIDSKEQISNDRAGNGLAPIPINRFNHYLRAFYTLIIEQLNRQVLTADDWARTVSIGDGNIGPRIRTLSKEEVATLTRNGATATRSYLQARQKPGKNAAHPTGIK